MFRHFLSSIFTKYSHLSNNRGGWNKRGGGAKAAKSINVEGGIFWKNLMHKSNKRRVEGEKSKKSINVEGGNVRGGWIFFQNQ